MFDATARDYGRNSAYKFMLNGIPFNEFTKSMYLMYVHVGEMFYDVFGEQILATVKTEVIKKEIHSSWRTDKNKFLNNTDL